MNTSQNNPELDVSRLKFENENIKEVLNKIISEYADYRIECDEICKEYEETIQLLTDSLERYKSEITKLSNEKEKMKQEQERLTKELEKSREKNKEKIKDIEILNNKIDQLEAKFNSIGKKETTLKSKVVTLETDNDHYLNKIHQYEEEVTDLKDNLENTIENLIMTQNDFEKYKNKKEEEVERLKLKLQEEKGTIRALMKQNKIGTHSRLRSSINLKQLEDNSDEMIETKIEVFKRKLSWSEESNLRGKIEKDEITSKNINIINNNDNINNIDNIDEYDIDKQFELLVEKRQGRNNRAMTLQKSKYNFGSILSKLRKRKEELVKFNQKMKREAANLVPY